MNKNKRINYRNFRNVEYMDMHGEFVGLTDSLTNSEIAPVVAAYKGAYNAFESCMVESTSHAIGRLNRARISAFGVLRSATELVGVMEGSSMAAAGRAYRDIVRVEGCLRDMGQSRLTDFFNRVIRELRWRPAGELAKSGIEVYLAMLETSQAEYLAAVKRRGAIGKYKSKSQPFDCRVKLDNRFEDLRNAAYGLATYHGAKDCEEFLVAVNGKLDKMCESLKDRRTAKLNEVPNTAQEAA